MATLDRTPRSSGRCAAILAAMLLVAALVTPAAAQTFKPAPAHGQMASGYSGQCSAVWDPDGGGPAPPLLVIGYSYGGVAAWDGSSFLSFGSSPDGEIHSVAVYNGQLYVGGNFSKIGSDPVNNVARWDGSHWQPLGTGMTGAGNPGNPKGNVFSMLVHNGQLYIGGSFVPTSTGTWTSFATWDGTTLTAGPASPAPISQMVDYNGSVYAANTIITPGVYRFDTDHWTTIGMLARSNVFTLAVYNDELYCGGDFNDFFGVPCRGIARWNGSVWVPLGSGLPPGAIVYSLATYNGVLVVGGVIPTAGGVTVNDIAQWDGTAWSSLGGGVHPLGYSSGVNYVVPYNGELLAMGYFDKAGGTTVNGLAHWNGAAWLPLIPGINAAVQAMYSTGSGIYLGGGFQFDWAGDVVHNGFGSDGTSVSYLAPPGLPNGTSGVIRAISNHLFPPFFDSYLIVGGSFSQAGGYTAYNVAAYNLIAGWTALGEGFNSAVNTLADYGGSIYAAGYFTASSSGTTTLRHLARYGSGGWTELGIGNFPNLYALARVNGQLAIGGARGGKPYPPADNGVTIWDGTSVLAVDYADGPVYALADWNGDIVAAGSFTAIGGVAASHVAIRDHVTGVWAPMGSGFAYGIPYALAAYDGHLYAGGTIMINPAAEFGRLEMWDGNTWTAFFGGLDGPVYALAPLGNNLEIGGDFQRSSSGVISPYWIRYNDNVLAVDDPAGPAPGGVSLGESWPNPARGATRIAFTLDRAGAARLTVFDLAGRRVRSLADGVLPAGRHEIAWDGADNAGRTTPPGLYFYRLETGGRSLTRRIVRMR
jgi:trimeric autotransporter adhesin